MSIPSRMVSKAPWSARWSSLCTGASNWQSRQSWLCDSAHFLLAPPGHGMSSHPGPWPFSPPCPPSPTSHEDGLVPLLSNSSRLTPATLLCQQLAKRRWFPRFLIYYQLSNLVMRGKYILSWDTLLALWVSFNRYNWILFLYSINPNFEMALTIFIYRCVLFMSLLQMLLCRLFSPVTNLS